MVKLGALTPHDIYNWNVSEAMTNDLDSSHIETLVGQFLTERFDVPVDKLAANPLMRDLGIDSIMLLDVMLEVEDRLGIKLHDLSMPANPRLYDIVELVERNMAAKG